MMTSEQKQEIDDMTYEHLLRRWRNAPVGDTIFQDEAGKYYSKVMGEKRIEVGNAAHVAASKAIG